MQPQDNVKITDLGGTENSPIFNFISPVLRRIYTHTQSHEGSFVVGPLPALEHGLEMLMFFTLIILVISHAVLVLPVMSRFK